MIYAISHFGVYVDYNYVDAPYMVSRLLALLLAFTLPLLLIGFFGLTAGIDLVFGFFVGLLISNFTNLLRLRLWLTRENIQLRKKVETFRESGRLLVKTSYKRGSSKGA